MVEKLTTLKDEKYQNRLVVVSMLDIGWIFENDLDIRELIVSLKDSPFESIFSTDLISSLVIFFGKKYKRGVIIWCFIPYVVYFFTTIIFFTWFTSGGIQDEEEKIIAFFMGFIIIILDLYFLFFELVVIARDGIWDYLADGFFNYLDLITTVLNAVLVFETLAES